MKKILFGLLLSAVLGASTPDTAKPETTLYVVALTGADLYAAPSFTAKVARRLPLGAVVNVRQTVASDDVKRIGAGLALPGDWLKITTPAYTGYLFSSDLSPRKPALKKNHHGMPYIDFLGPQKSSRTEKEPVTAKSRAGEYALKDITEYANATVTMTSFDSCFDHEYAFQRLALNEVYHHMISHYAGYEGQKLMQPRLLSKKGNVYTFTCGYGESDATQELHLTIHKNGTLVISSFDCT